MKRSSRKYCEKKDSRLEIRLSSTEKALLEYHARRYNCSTSRYLYLMIESAILPYQKMIREGKKTYDDFATNSNN